MIKIFQIFFIDHSDCNFNYLDVVIQFPFNNLFPSYGQFVQIHATDCSNSIDCIVMGIAAHIDCSANHDGG